MGIFNLFSKYKVGDLVNITVSDEDVWLEIVIAKITSVERGGYRVLEIEGSRSGKEYSVSKDWVYGIV